MLVAIGRDAMGQSYPVGFGIVAKENEENWTWFLECLEKALNIENGGSALVILSDRQKGLLLAVSKVLPNAIHGYCAHHLLKNVEKTANFKGLNGLFWKLVKAKTKDKFDNVLQEIRSQSEAAYLYLLNIDPKTFAQYCFPASRFSYLTSNLAEIINALLKEKRKLPHLGIIHWFYCWTMEKHYLRRKSIEEMNGT